MGSPMIIVETNTPIPCLPDDDDDRNRQLDPSRYRTPGSRDRFYPPTTSRDDPTGGGMDTSADGQSDFCAVLLAMACHDLRQPLQVIVAARDLLAERLGG